ncbi:MAG TPA: hypothetical protein VN648_29290, partial [Candidatus Methylomirabilis sp.]|nr:hypothetical protein [Candidatus Methylomirabilis sp.]
DGEDNEPQRFASYLTAALEGILPDTGEEARALLAAFPPPPLQTILAVLINKLKACPSPVTLILDDYQQITNTAVHEAIDFFLDRMPPALHLVIATRSDPPIRLARLRARGQLLELRAGDLRFTPDEAAAFLNQVMGLALSPEDISALENRTEGWIAGLQMAALSMRGRADTAEFIRAFSGSHRYILDYLAEEVLSHQPGEVIQFLLHTSILERLSAPLCDFVVNGESGIVNRESRTVITNDSRFTVLDSHSLLDYLDRSNLFLIPLDDQRLWYRYHSLFAELLKARLHQTEPGSVPGLHRRASSWLEQNGFITEAIQHLLAIGDDFRAAELIERYGPGLWLKSDPSVARLAGSLTIEALRSRPRLDLYYAWMLIGQGDTGRALALLTDLSSHLPSGDQVAGSRWMQSIIELVRQYATPLGAATDGVS